MEEIKTKGIVIKTSDFADSDKIVTIFSSDFGLIKARVRGVKKKGAKLAFAVQPFALVEFLLIKKGDFYSVINATSIDQFFGITNDFDDYILMLACLEVCGKTVKENDPQNDLFLLLIECLKAVCYDGSNAMSVFIKFMIEAMKILGFAIQIHNCACCGNSLSSVRGFSFEYNGIICGKCQNKNGYLELIEGEYAILKNIDKCSLNEISKLKFLSRENLVNIISLLAKDFRIFVDEEIETLKQFI